MVTILTIEFIKNIFPRGYKPQCASYKKSQTAESQPYKKQASANWWQHDNYEGCSTSAQYFSRFQWVPLCSVRALGWVWGSGLTPVKSCCSQGHQRSSAVTTTAVLPPKVDLKMIGWAARCKCNIRALTSMAVTAVLPASPSLIKCFLPAGKTACSSKKIPLVCSWTLLLLLGYDH